MIVGQFLSFGLGGADKASYSLTKGLIEHGIEVKVFYNEWSFPKPSPQFDSGVLLSRFDQCVALGVPMIRINNLSELNNHGIHILNTHRGGDDAWFLPGFESTPFNFKIVETNFHGHTSTKADVRVFPSHIMLQGKNINCAYRVIPNPIMCKMSDEDLKAHFKIEGKFVFGRIGRPSRDIYSPTCLKAFKLIENDNMHFLYVTPHPTTVDDARSFGIRSITFVDPTLDDVYISKLYNTFDVLCHSNSMGETFGNTIAEAMMHAKPVISHWGGNWPQAQQEVMGVSKLGYICPNDVNSYSALMIKLFTDKIEYMDYALYALDRAEKLYDYRVVASQYIELYRSLI